MQNISEDYVWPKGYHPKNLEIYYESNGKPKKKECKTRVIVWGDQINILNESSLCIVKWKSEVQNNVYSMLLFV